jgi:hypothetical protein
MRWWGDPTDKPGHKQAREYARPTSPANKEGELYRWREATTSRVPVGRGYRRAVCRWGEATDEPCAGGARLPTSRTYFPVQTKSKTLPLNGQASILAANPFRKGFSCEENNVRLSQMNVDAW